MVEDLIKQKALGSLNLARKAGALVTGFEKVKEAVKKKQSRFYRGSGGCRRRRERKSGILC